MASSRQKALERARSRGGESKATVATTEVTVTSKEQAPLPEVTTKTKVRGGPSIRGTITQLLKEGKSTTEISDVIKAQFPNSQAAQLPTKHIAFYRSRLKKEGAKAATAAEFAAPPKTLAATRGSAR